ncbi:MAG TPA: hypothetical protein VJA20_02710 [Candidatus Nanoarchaeia archaeon]|nr:hypothetical protein [Candidatus Nanoarchaeia archaeon]
MRQDYIHENFPIETDLVQSVYGIVSNLIYSKQHSGVRQSGLYGTRCFYNIRSDQMVPVLFGTLFSGSEYAEVLFSKAPDNKNGKLEIKLFGENSGRLLEIKSKLKNEVESQLKRREKE